MSDLQPEWEPASFRDRNGRVFYSAGSVFRGLSQRALHNWKILRGTQFFQRLVRDGKLVQTEQVDAGGSVDPAGFEGWPGVLKHERIPFVSYPYEWSFGMLKDAALLQLELLRAALDEDMILKDCSAFNIQWIGSKPVFIDIVSFEPLTPGTPWVGYRQFCQLFLYPLLLQAYKGVSFHAWMRGDLEGLAPEDLKKLMSPRDLLRPGVLRDVYLHSKLQGRYANTQRDVKADLRGAGFNKQLIGANVKRMAKIVTSLKWEPRESDWSEYTRKHSYTDEDHTAKRTFVRRAIASRSWRLIWDLGCNTGTFSQIAAEATRYVVAMDLDPVAVDRFYHTLKLSGNRSILPLVSNIANPAPNLGWRGLERKALPERGKPDLALCLALIHHVTITSNVPVREFVDWLATLETAIVIEFITRQDPMVQQLLRNKEDQYTDYHTDAFETCLSQAFNVRRREVLSSKTRILYYGTPRM